jgi:tRNA(Ile)-lysidine synthase
LAVTNAELLAHLRHQLQPCRKAGRWVLGFSGGLDSTVLLDLVHALQKTLPDTPPVLALHIHHGLSPHADSWAAHCRAQCAVRGVPVEVLPVQVDTGAGRSVEEAAREARYQAFASRLEVDDMLLLAHHADDQAETLLLRALRGAGPVGLGAMAARRAMAAGRLLRPLLDVPRAALLAWARGHGLAWIDDESNADARFDRNYLRLEVLPRLAARWPGYLDTLGRTARWQRESAGLLVELAEQDAARAVDACGRLSVAALLALSAPRQRNLLRHWLATLALPMPSEAQLAQIQAAALAAEDAQPRVHWGGAEVRRHRGLLYAMRALPAWLAPPARTWRLPDGLQASPGAAAGAVLDLADAGRLEAWPTTGAGLRAGLGPLTLQFRQGGERCRPAGRAHSQRLKKLLQDADLEPWLRDRVPLLYCRDELVAVGDLWVCEGWQAGPGERGWQLVWSRP